MPNAVASWSNPLVEIETHVRQAAKNTALDMKSPEGPGHLQRLIREQIDTWNEEHKHGLQDFRIDNVDAFAERAFKNLAGYGPLESLLEDDDVWEIAVNAPDQIFVKRHSGLNGYHDEVFHDDDHVVRTLTRILDDASGAHRKFDPAEGLQDAQLNTGARLHIVHGDIGRGGHTMVNIRKFTGVAIRSLEQLVKHDMLSLDAAKFLRAAIKARRSIVFAGAPGSGKTTLLSCCAGELEPSLRVVTAEEVFEADIPIANVASMQTRPARSDRPEIDLRRLVAGFLRMAPDVAVVGEVRDTEALALLLTLSSGVTGYTTIHAGSARQALTRLRFLSQLADTSSDIPMAALNSLVCDSIDVVVHCARVNGKVQVTEIIAVEELQGGQDAAMFTTTALFARSAPSAPLVWTGQVPSRLAPHMAGVGHTFCEVATREVTT